MRNHSLSMSRRQARLSRVARSSEFEKNSHRISGTRSQVHAGQNTPTVRDLVQPGGIVMSRLCNCPAVTASRCSQIASRCRPHTSGRPGSTTGHAALRKSESRRRPFSASRFAPFVAFASAFAVALRRLSAFKFSNSGVEFRIAQVP